MRLYLLRHAHPDVPDGPRFLGQADPPLDAYGREQALTIGVILQRPLAGLKLDVIVSSDLRRCAETAEIIAEQVKAPVITEEWLREIDTGAWEGLGPEEARRRYPTEYAARERDLIGHPFPGGESFRGVQTRVLAGFKRFVEESAAAGRENVVMIGHKGTNRVLLCHLQGKPLEELFSFSLGHCALNILDMPTSTDPTDERAHAG